MMAAAAAVAQVLHRPSMALVGLIPALPLFGAAVLLLSGKRWRGSSAGWFGAATIAASFVLSVVAFASFVKNPASARGGFVTHLWSWIHVGAFGVNVDLRIDPLSLVMILTVTFVGALI